MKKAAYSFLGLTVAALLLAQCAPSERLVVNCEVTGPIETNCYLLYTEKSKEAVLFDVGGPIDTLLSYIAENDLKLKYLFFTHGHPDHVAGLPAIRDRYPEALVCIAKQEYEDMQILKEWTEANMDPEELAEMRKDPKGAKLMEFDPATFGEPDIYLEDGQSLRLGNLAIRTILSPGHSRAGTCYHVDNVLLSGDVLFYRSVGRTDLLGGSPEAQVRSVRRLYTLLPDDTKVYPGHGSFTDIGSEKKENSEVTMESANLLN